MQLLGRQVDFLQQRNKMRRESMLEAIVNVTESDLTVDTQIVLGKIMGRIPMGGTYHKRYVELLAKSKIPDMNNALVFQLQTFIDDELVYTLPNIDDLPNLETVLCFLVKSFNEHIDFNDSLKMTVPCYIPYIKCIIHYEALISFAPFGKQMKDLLGCDVWREYIYKPKNYSQTAFVRLMLGKYFKYWDEFNGNSGNLDADCSNVTEMLTAIGISKARLIRDRIFDSELTVNQWMPFIRWDEKWREHGVVDLKVRAILNYFSTQTKLTEVQQLDLAVWVSLYPKWLNSFSYFEYNAGTDEAPEISKVRIHNHNVMDHLTLPKVNGKVNLKIHPKDWVRENITESLMTLIKKTNQFCTQVFPIDSSILKRIEEHYPNQEVEFLSSPNHLIEEGERMSNCVGGIRYVLGCGSGDFHIYHLANSSVDNHGITVMVNADPKKGVIGLVREVKGYENRDIDEVEANTVAELIGKIYLPDWSIGELMRMAN